MRYHVAMLFKESSLKAVDFTALKENTVADATLKSFNAQSGYWFGTFVADNESIRAIIGKIEDYKLADLLPLKGIQVEVMYTGTRVANGVTYPKYSIQF